MVWRSKEQLDGVAIAVSAERLGLMDYGVVHDEDRSCREIRELEVLLSQDQVAYEVKV